MIKHGDLVLANLGDGRCVASCAGQGGGRQLSLGDLLLGLARLRDVRGTARVLARHVVTILSRVRKLFCDRFKDKV